MEQPVTLRPPDEWRPDRRYGHRLMRLSATVDLPPAAGAAALGNQASNSASTTQNGKTKRR
ncbi:MAG: hypothetical protein H6668_00585 [Ardenticatenaceae bacterium]|nr:hypothetical protein [Ardenticatenaceae bacterium]